MSRTARATAGSQARRRIRSGGWSTRRPEPGSRDRRFSSPSSRARRSSADRIRGTPRAGRREPPRPSPALQSGVHEGGGPIADIRDVARRSGVSIATVSRVLNGTAKVSDEARERVLAEAAALEYVPSAAARTLVTRRSQILGIVLKHWRRPPGYRTPVLPGRPRGAEARGGGARLRPARLRRVPAEGIPPACAPPSSRRADPDGRRPA